jgi:hypothetical protein
VNERIGTELARVGIAIVYKGEIVPAESAYAQPPSAQHPNGAWKFGSVAPDVPLVDASEVELHRPPKNTARG